MNDFLKFWKPVRKYALDQYNLKTEQLDMLLFLYSEDWFDRDDFEMFQTLMPWNRKNFNEMVRDGWIIKAREFKAFKYKSRYCLSQRAKLVVQRVYRMLLGEENIPKIKSRDTYSARRFNLFTERAKFKLQQQRQPLELPHKRLR